MASIPSCVGEPLKRNVGLYRFLSLHETIASDRNHYHSDSDGLFVSAVRFGFCIFLVANTNNGSHQSVNGACASLCHHLAPANHNLFDIWFWRSVETKNIWLLAGSIVSRCR